MDRTATKILKAVHRDGEITLKYALSMADPKITSHVRQYPLALLIEEGYVGVTINNDPPDGTEAMREYFEATYLHIMTLPKTERAVEYNGIRASGTMALESERPFIKAKGSLYLDEIAEKRWDRLYSLSVAVTAGIVVAVVSAWLRGDV